MNKGTRFGRLWAQTVQGALGQCEPLFRNPTRRPPLVAIALAVDGKTAPNSDVNTTTVARFTSTDREQVYEKALSRFLIPKGVGGIVRWNRRGSLGRLTAGFGPRLYTNSGFQPATTVETADFGFRFVISSAERDDEAYIPSACI